MKRLTYGIDRDGYLISRMSGHRRGDDDLCIPVLDYDAIGQGGDFTGPLTYHLEQFPLTTILADSINWWHGIVWTKKIPVRMKNQHRAFWGMKPLRETA